MEDQERQEDEEIRKLQSYLTELGLDRLAEEIQYEKYARRVIEHRLAADYWAVQTNIWQERHEKSLDWAVSVQAALYDKAASYNNVVMTLGYAGFFAIWSQVAPKLGVQENAFIGVCLGSSLLLFIGWTLRTTIILTLNVRRYALIAGEEFESFAEQFEAHKNAEDKANRAVLRSQRLWPIFFITAVTLAVVPAIVLLAELLFQIGGIDLGIVTMFSKVLDGMAELNLSGSNS